ncbi:MAG TPA: phosphoglycolate phosphatase [Nitrosopumilaceae archaeon]|nr:phosphoglycolate phosphatase [Nitrosopumilaceae archaeon]
MQTKLFAIDIDGTITENGAGRIHLDALDALRHMVRLGHKVVFVSGRSSVEGYVLSVFGGMTRVAVGENGGAITFGPSDHKLLGNKEECMKAFQLIKSIIPEANEKPVFPRLTEVVLERNFDIDIAKDIVAKNNLPVQLSDSQYAFHINSSGIDKARGLSEVMKMFSMSAKDVIAIGDSETDVPLFKLAGLSIALGNAFDSVKSQATMSVSGKSGDGVIQALEHISLKLARV